MAVDKKFKTYTLALTANQEFDFNAEGDMYAVISSSGEFVITFDDSNRITKNVAGMGGRFTSPYNRVVLLSGTNQTVVVIFGFGEFTDARSTISAPTFNVTIETANSAPIIADVVCPPGVTTQIMTPNANRKSVTVFAGEFNIENLRIGCHSSVGAANGGILAPGGNGSLDTQTGVWVYNPGAANESVSIIELESI